ncbi:hypothetical protein HMPREF0574_0485 [Mobiluncus curtisii subsp. curtisii ATCC 35241]|nr:hypothetical protein HMPREF0574_0485 [Mobiluncus curtisii subsp. curtisii ATCC 35241]
MDEFKKFSWRIFQNAIFDQELEELVSYTLGASSCFRFPIMLSKPCLKPFPGYQPGVWGDLRMTCR